MQDLQGETAPAQDAEKTREDSSMERRNRLESNNKDAEEEAAHQPMVENKPPAQGAPGGSQSTAKSSPEKASEELELRTLIQQPDLNIGKISDDK
jgi:hypothetical protein